MTDKTKDIRNEIKRLGFMSGTKIIMKAQTQWNFSQSAALQFLDTLTNEEIHKIEYTNIWIAPYAVKSLFFYKPLGANE